MTSYHAALPAISSESSLSEYLAKINAMPYLTEEEEFMLAKRMQEHQDIDAAHRLVTSHLRLVAKIAMSFRGYGLPLFELISEGNIGLMQAVKKFDPDKGFRLSTYAMWWIKASIQEYVLRSWSLVKIGTTAAQKKLFFNLRRIKNRLQAVDDKQLTPEQVQQIAHEVNVSEKDVLEMDMRLTQHDKSLNDQAFQQEDGTQELIDFVEDERESHELVLAENQEKNLREKMLANALEALNEREKDIVIKRRLNSPAATLEDLSQIYHISRERIRQVEARALEKMRKHMEAATA